MQETCFKTKSTFKVHDFNIFEAIQAKEKSGIIIGAHKSLSPVLVSEYNSDFELIVVKVTVNNKGIRMITGVGPHENRSEDVIIADLQISKSPMGPTKKSGEAL